MANETKKSRSWTFHKKFKDFESADKARAELTKKGFEVRVRRRPRDETFDVKKRTVIS